jgi:hypothetical protein
MRRPLEKVEYAMSESPASEARQMSPAPLSTIPAALTEQVTKTGRQVYDQVAPVVGWYVEHLEDLVHEARADRAASRADETNGLADVLASLPHARVMSSVPGRVRLHVGLLKGREQLAEQTEQAVVSVPGVTQVSASATTGSVLILYNARQYTSPERGSPDTFLQALKQLRVRGGKVVFNHNQVQS